MGSRGPIGKPPERRHGHRSHEPAATLAVPTPDDGAPDPPAGLLKATQAAWVAFWASPMRALVTSADRPALERLFVLYDERDRAWRGYKRCRLVEGSQG